MSLEVPSTRKVAMVMGITAATYFGVRTWFVVSSALALDPENRTLLLDQATPSLVYWALFIVGGITLAVLALRFGRLRPTTQRVLLLGCAIFGVLAGVVAEWWTSLYYLFPAAILALSHRTTAHA